MTLDDARTAPALPLTQHERLQREAATQPHLISFAGGLPDARLFPRKQFAAAFVEAMKGDEALQYGWPEGSTGLRDQIARELCSRGAKVIPEHVLITSGAQQALAIAMAALARTDLAIGFDAETYPGALDAARARNARIVGLEEKANAYYVMPAIRNPWGKRMSTSDCARVLTAANQHDACIIEDDAYAETTFSTAPPPPLLATAPERVFHVGTFSKTLCPGLRIGWLVAPERFQRAALEAKQTRDLQSSGLGQAVLETYLRGEHYCALKQRLRKRYARRARLMARAIRAHLPDFRFEAPEGGFSIWLESDLRVSDERLLELAVEEGVSFDPGSAFRREPAPRLALRLSYSLVDDESIVPGLVALARAVRRARAE